VRLTGGYDWFAFDFPPEQRSWSMRLTASLPCSTTSSARRRCSARGGGAVAEARARDARSRRASPSSRRRGDRVGRARVAIADRAVCSRARTCACRRSATAIGVATILDLQTSQVALSDAEIAAVRARQALGTATARLEAILGQRLREES
jgi:hypothetical protein